MNFPKGWLGVQTLMDLIEIINSFTQTSKPHKKTYCAVPEEILPCPGGGGNGGGDKSISFKRKVWS